MYAIIKTGGKQYKVAEGDVIDIEKLPAESDVTFDDVLFLFDGKEYFIGEPCIAGASVDAKVIEETAGDKIQSIKYKRRKRQVRKFGHRQHYLRVEITQINCKSRPASKGKAAVTQVEAAPKAKEAKAKAAPKAKETATQAPSKAKKEAPKAKAAPKTTAKKAPKAETASKAKAAPKKAAAAKAPAKKKTTKKPQSEA